MKNEIVVAGQKYIVVSERPNMVFPGRTELWMHRPNGRTAYIASRLPSGYVTEPKGMWGLKAR